MCVVCVLCAGPGPAGPAVTECSLDREATLTKKGKRGKDAKEDKKKMAHEKEKEKERKGTVRFRKEDIGLPTDFQHVGHIGMDKQSAELDVTGIDVCFLLTFAITLAIYNYSILGVCCVISLLKVADCRHSYEIMKCQFIAGIYRRN